MQNAAFRVLGLDAVYVPLRCPAGQVPALMRSLRVGRRRGQRHGAAQGSRGAARWTAPVTGSRRLGPATPSGGRMRRCRGRQHRRRRGPCRGGPLEVAAGVWLVIGTGGSARAVAEAARQRGARLAVASRAPRNGVPLRLGAAALGVEGAAASRSGLVINATPLGLRERRSPSAATRRGARRAGRARHGLSTRRCTPWVRAHAARRGGAADGGREVLVAQGAAALRRWFPRHDPPVEVMRAAVRCCAR